MSGVIRTSVTSITIIIIMEAVGAVVTVEAVGAVVTVEAAVIMAGEAGTMEAAVDTTMAVVTPGKVTAPNARSLQSSRAEACADRRDD
jgi:hypothetical protein